MDEQEIKQMKKDIQELKEWKALKERQQLQSPLDPTSVKVLSETLKTVKLERLNVRDIYFEATNSSPTTAGQMRFFNNGATQQMRINTTWSVFVGSVDLTAV
jgi:oxalate decarboxylase/phosphoglucose isomerase-like protein (cupin superfamily)